jgi:hypothetical protein
MGALAQHEQKVGSFSLNMGLIGLIFYLYLAALEMLASKII